MRLGVPLDCEVAFVVNFSALADISSYGFQTANTILEWVNWVPRNGLTNSHILICYSGYQWEGDIGIGWLISQA